MFTSAVTQSSSDDLLGGGDVKNADVSGKADRNASKDDSKDEWGLHIF